MFPTASTTPFAHYPYLCINRYLDRYLLKFVDSACLSCTFTGAGREVCVDKVRDTCQVVVAVVVRENKHYECELDGERTQGIS